MTGDQLREELHPRFCFTANPRTASNESVVWKVFQTIENALGSPDRKTTDQVSASPFEDWCLVYRPTNNF